VGPFIEIAKDDAGTRDIDCPQKVFIYEPHRLGSALAVRRAEMHVENVQQMRAYADVGTKHAAIFPSGDAEVDMPDQFERPPAQRYVAVDAPAMFSRFAYCVKASKMLRKVAGLMILNGTAFMTHDFLQGYYVGVDFGEYPSDAFHANTAVQSSSFVDIVGGDPESTHDYT
jgi:hypothetical protein